jgi:ribosome recycling factor
MLSENSVNVFLTYQRSRPTVESRTALYSAAQKKAEDTRVAIRKQHQASLKKGKYAKRTVEYDEASLHIG